MPLGYSDVYRRALRNKYKLEGTFKVILPNFRFYIKRIRCTERLCNLFGVPQVISHLTQSHILVNSYQVATA